MADAFPLPDQTAEQVVAELIKLFTTYGIPDVLHSDQGHNFESSLLTKTLFTFGVRKTCTTAHHSRGDGMVERLNRSLLQLLQTIVEIKMTGSGIYPRFCMLTTQLSTPLPEFLP